MIFIKSWSTLWRNNNFVTTTNRVEYYDYHFQSFVPINVTIKPGDRINTHCVYDTSDDSKPVEFGLSSAQEM